MPDGSRKRRFSPNKPRRDWYARYRSCRFQRRFGLSIVPLAVAALRMAH